ncbi:hypothetical protein EDB83DRAFT_2374965, partial [Lactarius deliciosus]
MSQRCYSVRWWESQEAAGLRSFWTEPNLELAEYSFISIRGNHALPKHLARYQLLFTFGWI